MSAIGVTSPSLNAPTATYRVRWDRVVALAAALLVVLAVVLAVDAGPSQADAVPAAPVHVVVQASDTLWDLASTHAPSGVGTMEYAALVAEVNDVRAGHLIPGRLLVLPQD